ncbi:MAG: hypothetical protein M3R27_16815 [Bacteroidota bacterium]|nr:hypothetical protein [Bacteroidota bacterium]
MKKRFLLFILLLQSGLSFSENDPVKKIILHPRLGETISTEEKEKYQLFPEYRTQTFGSAYVYQLNDSVFMMVVNPIGAASFEKTISNQEILAIYKAVESFSNEEMKQLAEVEKERRQESANDIARFSLQFIFIALEILLAISN